MLQFLSVNQKKIGGKIKEQPSFCLRLSSPRHANPLLLTALYLRLYPPAFFAEVMNIFDLAAL